MRQKPLEKVEAGRVKEGDFKSPDGASFGLFEIMGPTGSFLTVMSSGADEEFGWEHVSVSLGHRPPNWREMCFVKDQFWDEEETVIQYHPRKQDYINCHPNCLHMWRPLNENVPTPPPSLVGPKTWN